MRIGNLITSIGHLFRVWIFDRVSGPVVLTSVESGSCTNITLIPLGRQNNYTKRNGKIGLLRDVFGRREGK